MVFVAIIAFFFDNRHFERTYPGVKEYLTPEEFRRTVRRNFGIMKEEWVKKYFKAFDRNHRCEERNRREPVYPLFWRSLTILLAFVQEAVSTVRSKLWHGTNSRAFWLKSTRPPFPMYTVVVYLHLFHTLKTKSLMFCFGLFCNLLNICFSLFRPGISCPHCCACAMAQWDDRLSGVRHGVCGNGPSADGQEGPFANRPVYREQYRPVSITLSG